MSASKGSGSKSGGTRGITVRVKTAKRRSISSNRWLQRQLNDPYVVRARQEGYRSRAAFKILEMDDKYHFFHEGATVIDLGAAPGGWAQVAVERCGEGNVLGLDLLPIEAVPGALFLEMDFMDDAAPERLRALCQEHFGRARAHLVLSDMAPNASGQPSLDHLRIMMLAEAAFEFAIEMLAPGGGFIAKVWQGGTQATLLARIKQHFTSVRHAKPPSSRQDSAETFVVATGFRGA